MALVPATSFRMGSENGLPDERPSRTVHISAFYLDKTEVTNAEFRRFVAATGYRTTAERTPDAADFPDVPKALLKPGAAVFRVGKGWKFVIGACWRHPQGPASTIVGKDEYPVVQVSWDDANAYARWAGKRLPTEAEWEAAARSSGPRAEYAWGEGPFNEHRPQANIWQGQFPEFDSGKDGFRGLSPVRHFAPNQLGLHDLAGNVWEWCSDWYEADAYSQLQDDNPRGPSAAPNSNSPDGLQRVMRGGSYLCAESYCRGYRITARMKSSPDTGLCNVGFRCAMDLRKG